MMRFCIGALIAQACLGASAVTILAPQDSSTVTERQPTISWGQDAAVSYKIELMSAQWPRGYALTLQAKDVCKNSVCSTRWKDELIVPNKSYIMYTVVGLDASGAQVSNSGLHAFYTSVNGLSPVFDTFRGAHLYSHALFGGFGARKSNQSAHGGVDIMVPGGTAAKAMCAGTIRSYVGSLNDPQAGIWSNSWKKRVTVECDPGSGGYQTLWLTYGHTAKRTDLEVGSRVEAGQIVGYIDHWYQDGNDPSNSHIHLGVSQNDPGLPWGYIPVPTKSKSTCNAVDVATRKDGLLSSQSNWIDPLALGIASGGVEAIQMVPGSTSEGCSVNLNSCSKSGLNCLWKWNPYGQGASYSPLLPKERTPIPAQKIVFSKNKLQELGATLHGSATLGKGKDGEPSVSFGGVDNPGHVQIPNRVALQFQGDLTVDLWALRTEDRGMNGWGRVVDGAGYAMAMLAKSHDNNGYGFMTDAAGGGWAASSRLFPFGVGTCAYSAPNIAVGQWYRVTMVFSSTTGYSTYVNKNRVWNCPQARHDLTEANNQDLFIGKYSDTWYPMFGSIQNVNFYGFGMTDTEVGGLK